MIVLIFTGDFIEIEEKKPSKPSNSCLVREEDDDDQSDEERVDMNDITGAKEREERREKFYSMQRECENLLRFGQLLLNH